MKHIVYVSYQFGIDTANVHTASREGHDAVQWGSNGRSVTNLSISASPYNDSPAALAPPPDNQVQSTENAVADVPAQESAS